jgi:cytochrome oxidase assembly protein ShyY1
MLPARHLGYAVQWFVMAMVLAIALICFCCERINEKTA